MPGSAAGNASAFANNFIRGFSFVDSIKRSNREEARRVALQKEARDERAFQKKRQRKADRRTDTLFAQQQADRTTAADKKRLQEEGDAFALANPDASIDELQKFAAFSPEAAAAIKRKNENARITGALKDVRPASQSQDPPSSAGQSLSAAVTAQETRAPGGTPVETFTDPNAPSTPPQDFTFGRDVGPSSLQSVDIDAASKFDPEFQKKGFFSKIADRVAGGGSEVVRGAEDIIAGAFNAPGRIRGAITGENINPPTQNVGNEFGGNLQVPADRFTTAAEFDALAANGATQREISAARDSNVAVLEELKRAGRRPRDFAVDTISRQGALLEGSDQGRRAAEAAQQRAAARAQDFLDPTVESTMEAVALEDPRAATVMYLQDRATLQGSNPNLAIQMDQRMLPVIDQAEADLKAEIITLDPASATGRRQTAALAVLQESRNAIAKGQPSISSQAGINSSGLKVGDQTRAQNVVDTIFDPDRPVPTLHTGSAVQTSATIAGRITPNRRLNDTQIEALAVLSQAGYIDKTTAMSVMMTGAWPPGKNPSGIKSIREAGNNVYAITESGNVLMLQRGKTKVPKPVATREIGDDQINWVSQGIRSTFPNMQDNQVNGLMNIMFTNPGWVRSRFNVNSQEGMRRLGAMLAESKTFASKKFTELDEGFFTNTKNAPTVNEIMMDPDLRDRLANEFDLEYIPLPDLKDIGGVDSEALRQTLREGRAGPTAAANADAYSDEQVKEVWARWQMMQLDQAGRLDQDGKILPAPQGQ